MHSEDVQVTFRLHHNNQPTEAREALVAFLKDWAVFPQGETVNGTEIAVTSLWLQPED